MKITLLTHFNEDGALRLLNWLAGENARTLRQRPDLPLLYDSGVVYRREDDELWRDINHVFASGSEDCDSLAAARAGELIARGWRALTPGEGGFEQARRARLESIPAQVFLRTRSPRERPGLYHCLVRYQVDSQEYRDDPSARLGMNGVISDTQRQRWVKALGPEVASRLTAEPLQMGGVVPLVRCVRRRLASPDQTWRTTLIESDGS